MRYDARMKRGLFLLIWMACDLLLFVATYVVAYVLRVGFLFNSTDFPIDRYLQAVALVSPLLLLILLSFRVYALSRVQATIKNMIHIAYACLITLALFSLTYYFLFGEFFSRLLLVMAGGLSFAALALWHMAFDQWQRTLLRGKKPSYPLLVVGANRDAERLITMLTTKRSVFTPVAVLDSRGTRETSIAGVPVRGKLDKLEQTIKELKITHLVQCAELEHTINLLSICRQHRITYMLLPSVLGIVEGDERVELLENRMPVTVVTQSPAWASLFV